MSLPDFTLKYLIQNFHLAPNVLTDALFTSLPKNIIGPDQLDVPRVQEIKMVALGKRHFLFCLSAEPKRPSQGPFSNFRLVTQPNLKDNSKQ